MHPGTSYWSRSTVLPCDNSTSILSMFPRIGSMLTIIGSPSAGNVRNKTWILPFMPHFCQFYIRIKAVLSVERLGLALLWGVHVERQKGSHSVRDETWNILPDHTGCLPEFHGIFTCKKTSLTQSIRLISSKTMLLWDVGRGIVCRCSSWFSSLISDPHTTYMGHRISDSWLVTGLTIPYIEMK